MGDGTRFALGIAIMIGAMIFFFFALHPNGVTGVKNPVDALKWLMDEVNGTNAASNAASTNVAPTPSGSNVSLLNPTGAV